VGWLLLKDLRILRRSPLLVALLVLYPVLIAVLIGFALSRGPEKPAVAIYNGVPATQSRLQLGGQRIDLSEQARELFKAVDPVPVGSRREAIQKVRNGDVLGALVVPPNVVENLQSTLKPGTVEVFYNAEDPAKKAFVQNTIKAQVQNANVALTKRIALEALQLLQLIRTGGHYSFLGQRLDILGLERSQRILDRARGSLPRDSRLGAQVERVAGFARLARQSLGFSDDVLDVVGQPIRVRQHVIQGGTTSLSSFAVAVAVAISLMFITVLLAAGSLALEREEHAFPRLVRGLVSRAGLLTEKAVLATVCSLAVTLVMLAGIGLFVDLQWHRFPQWLAALLLAALAFATLGLAIGGLAREVRVASLLALMLSLPLAFLALVPSGAVAPGLYDLIRAVSAVFPFKPTLQAMNAALNDSGGLPGPLLHLAALALAFGALSRVALRRFA
jgi:ABC-type multidrug transport system permease subunit